MDLFGLEIPDITTAILDSIYHEYISPFILQAYFNPRDSNISINGKEVSVDVAIIEDIVDGSNTSDSSSANDDTAASTKNSSKSSFRALVPVIDYYFESTDEHDLNTDIETLNTRLKGSLSPVMKNKIFGAETSVPLSPAFQEISDISSSKQNKTTENSDVMNNNQSVEDPNSLDKPSVVSTYMGDSFFYSEYYPSEDSFLQDPLKGQLTRAVAMTFFSKVNISQSTYMKVDI
jgi:hypothetical protein